MSRHAIAGRCGTADRMAIHPFPQEVVTRIDLVEASGRLSYGIGRACDDLAVLNVFPSDLGLDLLALATHVHAADTRVCRSTESQDSWTRELRVVVPVSAPARWTEVAPLLKRMLDFLTGDLWTLSFRSWPNGVRPERPPRPPGAIELGLDGVSLFSGGLDSLIGAIDLLEAGMDPLFVSHAQEPAISNAQTACFSGLAEHYGRPLRRLGMWMALENGLVQNVASEPSTRSRSFLFLALGAFAGTGLGDEFTLRVPENGLIALNVPLDHLRLGSLSTRTTHPFYLARWNELLATMGMRGQVTNPYWNRTKGEMTGECANRALLTRVLGSTLSCSSPTKGRWKGRGIQHCGYCLPCLVRRAALLGALGRGADPTVYTIGDLEARTLNTVQAEGQVIRSLQMAIGRFRGSPQLARLLVHKSGPLSDAPENNEALSGVYQRGMAELSELLARARAEPR